MLKKDKALLLLLPVMVAVFGFGLARLFQLRFEAGDVYPPGSSLRADPLGTKAFYESLRMLPGMMVRRFTQPLNKLGEGRGTTLFVFGASTFEMNRSAEDEYKKLEQFMFDGGRIVISFAPLNTRPWTIRREEARKQRKVAEKKPDRENQKADGNDGDKSAPPKNKRPLDEDEDRPGVKRISLKDRWNAEFGYEDLPKDADGVYQSVVARRQADEDLPESVTWHTALFFESPGTNWDVIYARGKRPVLIERKFGRGSIVLSADSYFLSNEAMRQERHPTLLTWLTGANREVLFDETHLGVMEEPGIAALVRKYRLHGLVIGLVLLAGLFVWKKAISFVPAYDEEQAERHGDAVAGKDSAAGFVNLLRRSISPSEILPVCFAEWKKARAHGPAGLDKKTEQAAAVIAEEQARPARQRNAVECYRKISRLLSERTSATTAKPEA